MHMRGFYFWLPALAAILVCGLLGYSLGFSFPKILVFAVVLCLPVSVFFGLVLTSAFNPKIEEHYPDYLDLNPRI